MESKITPEEHKRLAKKLGICWHDVFASSFHSMPFSCRLCGRVFKTRKDGNNPNFSNPLVMLRKMMKREDWPKFLLTIGPIIYRMETADILIPVSMEVVYLKYITDEPKPGELCLLARAALEWLDKQFLGHSDGEPYDPRIEDR